MSVSGLCQVLRGGASYLPKSYASRAVLVGLASAAYYVFQRSSAGFYLAGACMAGALCLGVKKRFFSSIVPLDKEVNDRLKRGEFADSEVTGILSEMQTAVQEGTFLQDRATFFERLNNLGRSGKRQMGALSKQLHRRIHSFPIGRNVKDLPMPFGASPIRSRIFSFLKPNELARTERVSPTWHKAVSFTDFAWKNQYRALIGRSDLKDEMEEIFYKQIFKDLQPRMYAKQFYQSLGLEVGEVLPLPESAISKADIFLYVPEYLEMQVPAGSRVRLDQQGRLNKNGAPLAEAKKLRFPLTLNNILFFVEERLQRNVFDDLDLETWQRILEQHGDSHFPSHWSCQKKELLGKGLAFVAQAAKAEKEGLIVVSILDRVLCNLFEMLKKGSFVDTEDGVAVTSSTVEDENQNRFQATLTVVNPKNNLQFDMEEHRFVVDEKAIESHKDLAPRLQAVDRGILDPQLMGAAVAVRS